jgi:hypothetical protein
LLRRPSVFSTAKFCAPYDPPANRLNPSEEPLGNLMHSALLIAINIALPGIMLEQIAKYATVTA